MPSAADRAAIRTGARVPVVLLIAPYPIRRPRHGGQLRTAAMVRAYESAGYAVKPIGFYQPEAYVAADVGPADVAFHRDSPQRLYRGEDVPALSDFLMGAFSIADERAFRRVAGAVAGGVGVIQFEQPWFYPLARRLKRERAECHGAVLVFSSQNIEAPMKREILESMGGGSVIAEAIADIEALEREAAQGSDLCLAVTAEDATVLREHGAANVVLAPNGISPWTLTEQKSTEWRAKLPTQPWPLFIASAHPPNFTGFIEVVGDALACIPPGSRLVVAGGVGPYLADALSRSRWRDLNLSRLQVLGVIDEEDLAAVKGLADVFLLPIGAGGGSNIKTAEALYSGKAVICTRTALRGFEGYAMLPEVTIADSPREFQASIRQVLKRNVSISAVPGIGGLRERLTWEACLAPVPKEVSRKLATVKPPG